MNLKTYIQNLFRNRGLQNYVLLEVLFLIILILSVLSFFSERQSNKDFQKFAQQYVDNYNRRVIGQIENEIQNISQIPVQASHLLSPYIDFGAQNIPVRFDNPTNKFLKQILKENSHMSSLYLGAKDDSFFQIRKVREGDKYFLKNETNLPVVVSYSIRVIDRSTESHTETFYYLDDNGIIVDKEVNLSPVYTPSKRPWYNDAVGRTGVYVGSVYTFGLTPHLVMTASTPILDAGENVKGVIAADYNIRSLSFLLNRKNLTTNTQTYLLDKNFIKKNGEVDFVDASEMAKKPWKKDMLKLEIIASSEKNLPMRNSGEIARTINVSERRHTDLWPALEAYYEKKEEAFVLDIQDSPHIVNLMSFGDNFGKQWALVSIVPYNDLSDLFFSTKEDIFSLYIFILFIAVLQIILLARRIAFPIEDLKEEAEKIKEFSLDGPVDIKSPIREVSALADTMKDMKLSLKSFTKYMPLQLVRNLLKNKADIVVGGESKRLTLFFSDIAGFTTISEAMEPNALMHHLSEYFEEVTSILIEHQGTIDKYIGDAVMVFWGAPNEDKNQEYNACISALLIQNKLKELNKKWATKGFPELGTRIGLHVGEVVVGNVGSSDRMNYTVIGDSVNLAARLEGTNKYYDTNIIISESLYEVVKDKFLCRTLDIVAVKGKTKGVRIYELVTELGNKNLAVPKKQVEFIEKFEKGFSFYLNHNFAKALEMFEPLKGLHEPYDRLLGVYIERCNDYLKSPPASDWDGVFKLDKK